MKIKNYYLILVIIMLSIFIFIHAAETSFSKTGVTDDKPKRLGLVKELHKLIREKRSDGCDVSELIDLDRLSKEAFRAGDKNKGKQLLRKALSIARELTPNTSKLENDQERPLKNPSELMVPPKATLPSPLSSNKASGTFSANSATTRTVEIELSILEGEVICTYAIPERVPLGDTQSVDINAVFKSEVNEIKNGKLTLILDERPVFIELLKSKSTSHQSTLSRQNIAKSPFGIILYDELKMALAGDEKALKNPVDAGVKWVRLSGRLQAAWDLLEKGPLGSGKYDWQKFDKAVRLLNQHGLSIFCIINPFHRLDQKKDKPNGKPPIDMDAYIKFIQDMVERYDGDGKNDCPGSPVIHCWQIHNEINLRHFWKDTAQAYAKLYKITFEAIKRVNPNAKVALGSANNLDGFFNSPSLGLNNVLKELGRIEGEIEILDFHWYKSFGDYKIHPTGNQKLTTFVQEKLPAAISSYGFNDVELWFTEVGTHSGSHVQGRHGLFPPQSENKQAIELLRRYVYFMANGIKKIFWAGMLEENSPYLFGPNDYYNNVGLIYNGEGKDDLGKGIKKASFYTYKLMTRKLEGAKWDCIEKIKEGSDGIYAYKFVNESTEEPVWVVWVD